MYARDKLRRIYVCIISLSSEQIAIYVHVRVRFADELIGFVQDRCSHSSIAT